MQAISLSTPLSIKAAFSFPLQSRIARREVLIGAALLLLPGIGWLLNMGHRIAMTHRMQHGGAAWPAWPAWNDWPAWKELSRHGLITFLGMVEYHAPAAVCHGVAWFRDEPWLHLPGAVLWVLATIAVPGYMSHYCYTLDAREVFDPMRAMRRVLQGGVAYWHAWTIALAALCLSFLGLIAFGVGFLVTSVWFWQVAGFSFATVFTQRFALRNPDGIRACSATSAA